MPSYRLVIEYKGTRYFGWQVQPNQKTIQGEINLVLKKIVQSDQIYSIGASRTDRGVHALGQVARVDIPIVMEPINLKNALNGHLSCDIKILEIEKCLSNFHPIYDTKKKLYHYCFTLEYPPPAQLRDTIAFCKSSLDLGVVREACKMLEGEHDFQNFFTVGSSISSTIRTLYNCSIKFIESDLFWRKSYPGYFVFEFQGNGFLKQMVRLLVGALWNIGRGKVSLKDLEKALEHPLKNKLGAVAPPEGLYLLEVC